MPTIKLKGETDGSAGFTARGDLVVASADLQISVSLTREEAVALGKKLVAWGAPVEPKKPGSQRRLGSTKK